MSILVSALSTIPASLNAFRLVVSSLFWPLSGCVLCSNLILYLLPKRQQQQQAKLISTQQGLPMLACWPAGDERQTKD